MERTSIEEVAPVEFAPGATGRRLADALGTTELALTQYRIEPGGELPSGLHAHADQEEIFVVLDGCAEFETLDGILTVESDEAIRFAPGEFQSGRNGGDDALVILGMGAPRDSEDVRIPVDCSVCDHPDLRLDIGDDGIAFVCPSCAETWTPASCPTCDSDDLHVTTAGNDDAVAGTIARCRACESTFERPPVESGW